MAIPFDIFDQLRLSKSPEFNQLSPEIAAAYANSIRSFLTSEETRKRLMEMGGPEMVARAASIVDVATNPKAIADSRARARNLESRGLHTRVGEGFASALDFLGLGEPLAGLASGLMGGGFTQGGGSINTAATFPPLPAESSNLPLLGEQDPVALAAQMGAFIPPAILAVMTGGAAVGATGLPAVAPATASAVGYGLGGVGMEATRQGLRYFGKDEGIDPSSIAREGLIFGVSGAPMPGGPVVSRILASLATGATAAAAPPLLGQETDPTRVASEALFGLLFGNPKAGKITSADLPGPRLEFDEALAPKIAQPEAAPGKPAPTPKPPELWPEKLEEIAASAPEAEKKNLIDRATAARELSKLPEETLEQLKVLADNDQQLQMVTDALVTKRGQVRAAPDAPPVNTLPPKTYTIDVSTQGERIAGELAKLTVDPGIFKAPKGDPQFNADAISYKAITRAAVEKPPKSTEAKRIMADMPPEKRFELALSLEDARNALKKELNAAGKSVPDEIVLDKMATERLGLKFKKFKDTEEGPVRFEVEFTPTRKFPTPMESIRQMMIDEFDLEARNANQKIVIAVNEGNTQLKQQLEDSLKVIEEQKSKITGSMVPEVPDVDAAKFLFSKMITDMNTNEIGGLLSNLPAPLRPFEAELRASAKAEIAERPAIKQIVNELKAQEAKLVERGELFVADENAVRTTPVGATAKKKLTPEEQLRKRAAISDVKIDKLPNGMYDLTVNGVNLLSGTRAEIDQMLRDVDAAITNKRPAKGVKRAAVEVAAKRKNITVQQLGEGKVQMINRETGEVMVHNNLQEATEHIASVPTKPASELIPGGDLILPGANGSIGGPGGDGRIVFDIPDTPKGKFPEKLHQTFGTKGELFARMEDATNVPVWSKGWAPLSRAMNARDAWQGPNSILLGQALKGVKANRMRIVNDLLITAPKWKRMVQDGLNASVAEIKAAERLRLWFRGVLDLDNKSLDKFLYEVLPTFRSVGGDPTKVTTDWAFDGSLRMILDDIFKGYIKLEEPNARVLATDILHSVGREKFLREPLGQVRELTDYLTSQTRVPGIDPVQRRQADAMRMLLEEFTDLAAFGASAGEGTARLLQSFFGGLKERGLIKEIPTAKDVDRFATELTAYTSGAALSMRPAVAFRNMFQRMLTGNQIGYDNLFAGWKKSYTPEGRRAVEEAGIFNQPVTFLMDELLNAFQGEHRIREMVLKGQSWGMKPYRNIEFNNRAVTYLSGMEAIARHAELLKAGKVNEFLLRTGLALEPRFIQRQVLKSLNNVPIGAWDEAVRKAGDAFGKRLVETTQFVYHRANAPGWMTTIPGRFMGQFGMWNVGYAEHMIRSLKNGLGDGNDVSAIASRHFLYRMLGTSLGLSALGYLFGVDTSSWNRANPLDINIGPWAGVLRDMWTLGANTDDQFGRRLAERNLERTINTFWFPFGGALQDIGQSTEYNDPLSRMLVLLGFTVPKDKKDLL